MIKGYINKKREQFSAWEKRRANVPGPWHEETPGNKPIKVPEQFVMTRRNLLWYAAVLILIALAGTQEANDGTLSLPLVSAELPIVPLSLLILLASLPTAFNFSFYGRRVSLVHSRGICRTEFDDIERSLNQLSTKIRNWNNLVEDINAKLAPLAPFNLEKVESDAEFFFESIQTYKTEVDQRLDELKTAVTKGEKPRRFQSIETFNEAVIFEVDEIKGEVENFFADAKEIKVSLLSPIKKNREISLQVTSPEIAPVIEDISEIKRDFGKLDESLNGSDKFKFRWIDVRLAWIVYAVACLLTIVGAGKVVFSWFEGSLVETILLLGRIRG